MKPVLLGHTTWSGCPPKLEYTRFSLHSMGCLSAGEAKLLAMVASILVPTGLGFELKFLCAQIQLAFLNYPADQCWVFTFTVVPGPLDASKCACQGIGLETARAGEEAMFSVNVFDGFGNPRLIGGDDISAMIHQGGIDVNHDGKVARVNDLGCGRSSTRVPRSLAASFHSYHHYGNYCLAN